MKTTVPFSTIRRDSGADRLRYVRVDQLRDDAGVRIQAVAPPAIHADVLPLDRTQLVREAPDAHWEQRRGERLVGRCSLWWTRTPRRHGRRVGFIGHIAAEDRHMPALLRHACEQLSAHHCTLAVGPVNGSTWRNYRLVTETSTHPAFFLEPENPLQWPDLFVQAGFDPLAHYFSALCSHLDVEEPRITRTKRRLAEAGMCVRPIDPHALEADLMKIFSVARAVFRNNLLYSEPTREEFIADCRLLAAAVPLDLVLIAEAAGDPVGFVFVLPDLLQVQRGERIDTVIVKTLAALPGRRFAGLGQWLLTEVQQRAHALGFRRSIHALVRDAGHLQRISGRAAEPIRKYTLFAKVLPR